MYVFQSEQKLQLWL